MDASTSLGKKPRLQNACDECRKKKGAFPASSPLMIDKAHEFGFQFDVIVLLHHTGYAPDASHQRRGPKLGIQMDAARALVNRILSTLNPFAVPQEPGEVKDMLVELASYARCLEKQLLLARESSFEVDFTATPTYSIDKKEPKKLDEQRQITDCIDSLSQEFGQVAFGRPEPHFGKSSHFLLIDSAMDARRDDLGGRTGALFTHTVFNRIRRPLFWESRPVGTWRLGKP
ncbi:Gypsy retrotransposon integrase-like protein 1 [Marasmius sp. AFHP31]|nr:Gypsy retrotransposon integrase-like protein 1 [Marasmius sp. AFHP31]